MKSTKRTAAVFLIAAFMLTVLALGASAQQGNATIGTVNNYTGAITLDGVKDAAYAAHGKKLSATLWEGHGEDKTGTVWADYWFLFTDDFQKLYIYTEMHDDVIIAPTAEKQSWWDGACHTDCVELWLDPTNNAGQYGKEDLRRAEGFHYRTDVSGFASGIFWGVHTLGNENCRPYFESKVQMTGYGYNVEWMIDCSAFSKVGVVPQAGQLWGFQIMAKDVYSEKHCGEYWAHRDKDGNYVDYDYNTDYLMCDYVFYDEVKTTSNNPRKAYLDMAELDNLKLGKNVSDAQPDTDPDPVDTTDTTDQTGKDSTTTSGDSKPSAPQTADPILIAAAALFAGAGTAVVLRKRRR